MEFLVRYGADVIPLAVTSGPSTKHIKEDINALALPAHLGAPRGSPVLVVAHFARDERSGRKEGQIMRARVKSNR